MPKVTVNGVELFYEQHCSHCGTVGKDMKCVCKVATSILLVMGFQARGEAWRFNLDAFLEYKVPDTEGEVACCWLDNRGIGETTHPKDRHQYSTTLMAEDALALMDHLGWKKAHVFGHSMGGMISCKIASLAPERIHSLALISVTGGRWQAVNSIAKRLPGLLKHGITSAKTAEQKARATLYCHFSRMWLKETPDDPLSQTPDARKHQRRKEELIEEYVSQMEGGDGSSASSAHGTKGQARAIWRHSVTKGDVRRIKSGNFPILVIHGRKDVIAHSQYGEGLARKLGASSLYTNAGHFITRESEEEVNEALLSLIARVHRRPRPKAKPGPWRPRPASTGNLSALDLASGVGSSRGTSRPQSPLSPNALPASLLTAFSTDMDRASVDETQPSG